MMRRISNHVVALAALFGATSASAQHPMVLAKLRELDAAAPQPSTAAITAALTTTAKAYGEANKTCIPTAIKLGDIAPVTGARDILGAILAGELRNAWTVYGSHEGCPGTEPVRYMVMQMTDNSLIAPPINLGRTFANPSIMRDTSALAGVAAAQKAKSIDAACSGHDMKMDATRISGQSQDLGEDLFGARYAGSWSEIWRFETCGRKFDVPVNFRADGDGGAYTEVKNAEVALVR